MEHHADGSGSGDERQYQMNPTPEEIAHSRDVFSALFAEAHDVFACIAYAMSMLLSGKAKVEAVANAFASGFPKTLIRKWKGYGYDFAQMVVTDITEGQQIVDLVREHGKQKARSKAIQLIVTALDNMMSVEELDRRIQAALPHSIQGTAPSCENSLIREVIKRLDDAATQHEEIKAGVQEAREASRRSEQASARTEAVVAGRNAHLLRTSADLVEFCKKVDAKRKPKHGACLNKMQAINDAWTEVSSLPKQ